MSLGKVDFDGRAWRIYDLKPHVSIRFKKMFAGIKGAATPPFVLLHTPDRVADLEWFMSRYPLDLSDRAANGMTEAMEVFRRQKATVEAIHAAEYTPPAAVGFRAPERAHAYQERAAALWHTTRRMLLMDDVGLGKTVSALAGISGGWGLPAVVVAQAHLASQWVAYIRRFTHLTAHEIKDRAPRQLPAADVYVFRYSNIGAWGVLAETIDAKTLILDEVQELRHGRGTDKGQGARAFADVAENVIGLTATPIYNYGSEIWNVVNMVSPGALGTWDEFTVNWCTTHGSHWIVEDPQALGSYLVDTGLALRRTCESAEVALTMPPQFKTIHEVEWNDDDAQSDRDLQLRLAERVVSGAFTMRGQAARELDILLRRETGVAKAREAAAYVRMLVDAGERVVLFGWHRDVYAIWQKAFAAAGIGYAMFTGSEAAPAKARAKAEFCGGAARVLIMSLRSGAGLDGLQHHATQAVFGELDWSPQVHVQATGRLARQGQTKPVTSHFLHVEGGSDPVVMGVLGLKSSQSQGILDPFLTTHEATPIDATRMRRLAEAILETKSN